MITDEQQREFAGRIRQVEADLKNLLEDMRRADPMGTTGVRSELSTAKGAVGRAIAELGGGYRATDETRATAEAIIKGSPHAAPTGTRSIRLSSVRKGKDKAKRDDE